eukprot:PhF_6_TR9191/c2_g2_i1/m.14355
MNVVIAPSRAPKARAYVAIAYSSAFSQNRAIIFGGESSLSSQLDDLWEFDLELNLWRELVSVDTVKPQGRRRACIVNTMHSGLLMINGATSLHLDERWSLKFINTSHVRWSAMASTSTKDMANYIQRDGTVCAYSYNSPNVYLIGGAYEGSEYEIAYSVTSGVNQKFPPTPGSRNLGQSSGAPYLDKWYFFGGYDDFGAALSISFTLSISSMCAPGSFRNTLGQCQFCSAGSYGELAGECQLCTPGTYNG